MDQATRNRLVALEKDVEDLKNTVRFMTQVEADRQVAAKQPPVAPASSASKASSSDK